MEGPLGKPFEKPHGPTVGNDWPKRLVLAEKANSDDKLKLVTPYFLNNDKRNAVVFAEKL